MVQIKVQFAASPRLLSNDVWETFEGFVISQTVPNGQHATLDLPDDYDATAIDAMTASWLARGLIVDDGWGPWRYVHEDYVVPEPPPDPSIVVPMARSLGDMQQMVGVTEMTRRLAYAVPGDDVLVGVVDTGLDARDPCFEGRDLRGDLQDTYGHGTGVCSIIEDGILYMIASLRTGTGTEPEIGRAIRELADRGCRVMNLSLGGSPSSVIDEAVNYAKARGCVVIVAAGNGGGAPIGSPGRAADILCMAYNINRQWASFTDGRNWTNPNRLGGPGEGVVVAVPGGGYTLQNGTSFSAPHVTEVAVLLTRAGLNRQAIISYLLAHLGQAPDNLGLMLASDFGATPVEPPGQTDMAVIHDFAAETLRVFNQSRFITRAEIDSAETLEEAKAATAKVFDTELGPAAVYLSEIEARSRPKVEPPPDPEPPVVEPPPPSREIACVYGTYSGHGLAEDVYPGWSDDEVQWGPHHGVPIIAPEDGVVELYSIGTPLALADKDPVYVQAWNALFDGWTCKAVGLQQAMYVLVWRPARAYSVEGIAIGWEGWGHVGPNVVTGQVRKGTVIGVTWDSGIRWEPRIDTRAAHGHAIVGAPGTQLSPNGNLPGRLAIVSQGWRTTRLGSVPGPNEYQGGQFAAGRPRVDFTRAGRALPLIPA